MRHCAAQHRAQRAQHSTTFNIAERSTLQCNAVQDKIVQYRTAQHNTIDDKILHHKIAHRRVLLRGWHSVRDRKLRRTSNIELRFGSFDAISKLLNISLERTYIIESNQCPMRILNSNNKLGLSNCTEHFLSFIFSDAHYRMWHTDSARLH